MFGSTTSVTWILVLSTLGCFGSVSAVRDDADDPKRAPIQWRISPQQGSVALDSESKKQIVKEKVSKDVQVQSNGATNDKLPNDKVEGVLSPETAGDRIQGDANITGYEFAAMREESVILERILFTFEAFDKPIRWALQVSIWIVTIAAISYWYSKRQRPEHGPGTLLCCLAFPLWPASWLSICFPIDESTASQENQWEAAAALQEKETPPFPGPHSQGRPSMSAGAPGPTGQPQFKAPGAAPGRPSFAQRQGQFQAPVPAKSFAPAPPQQQVQGQVPATGSLASVQPPNQGKAPPGNPTGSFATAVASAPPQQVAEAPSGDPPAHLQAPLASLSAPFPDQTPAEQGRIDPSLSEQEQLEAVAAQGAPRAARPVTQD